ncbi:MAG TPA: hypothetical protein VF217_03500 [Rhodanobacteraceae bacterium]
MTTIDYTLSADRYSKTWIATITGKDSNYGYAREFVARGATEHSRSGKTWRITYSLRPGLYEECERGTRSYTLVWAKADGELGLCDCSAERAERIAVGMDAGMSFDEARIASKEAHS